MEEEPEEDAEEDASETSAPARGNVPSAGKQPGAYVCRASDRDLFVLARAYRKSDRVSLRAAEGKGALQGALQGARVAIRAARGRRSPFERVW